MQRNARFVWLKVVRHRQVGKEWLCKSFQSTPYLRRMGKSKKISTTMNKIWLFSMPDSSLSKGTWLGRAYSVDNQGLGDSYEVLCPLKFRRSLPRIASYAGALAPNSKRLVPGKPPYPGAWPLNFRGCCPGSHPKCSLNFRGPKN